AVVYYGRVVTDPAELEPLTAPVLGIFGAEDDGIPVESVQAFRAALDELGKEATVTIYQGADHAFANPSGTRYDAAAAEDAWQKTLDFFHRHLDG
ncbi:MAG: dienelactone hydrolase family protein, partial [Thermoanaerobaculia bacterium]|nr:dienelactone hydrolase family protein [Thermoanaerobaculia bacterium]